MSAESDPIASEVHSSWVPMIGLLILAAVSAVAIVPASRLPAYTPHEIPDPAPRRG